jgi:hypothetical protein
LVTMGCGVYRVLTMTTVFCVVAIYVCVAWATWQFLTRPLININRSDRISCLALAALWPLVIGALVVMMLPRRKLRRAG